MDLLSNKLESQLLRIVGVIVVAIWLLNWIVEAIGISVDDFTAGNVLSWAAILIATLAALFIVKGLLMVLTKGAGKMSLSAFKTEFGVLIVSLGFFVAIQAGWLGGVGIATIIGS